MTNPRFLTKTRFKMGTECPTKLFYTGKSEYANAKLEDPFLAALADGGFQVGELAKCYYPDGHDITTLNYAAAEEQTLKLLKHESVVIFEPAIRFNNLFIRIDILIKTGNHLELIEVKAKSYSSQQDGDFLGARGGIQSGWKSYLYDVAFQKHVLKSAFPESQVSSFLYLVNKNTTAATDGLNQKFLLVLDANNRKGIKVSTKLTAEDLATPLLIKVNTDSVLKKIYDEELTEGMPAFSFKDNISVFSEHYEKDIRIAPVIGKKCKSCEFMATPSEENTGKLSGFRTCWKEQLHWQDTDFKDPNILEIWNFRQTDNFLERGIIKIKDVEKEDISITESGDPALTASERQWMQIDKVKNNDTSVYFDVDSVRSEINSWTYPLHFIDFETNSAAIPFHKGMAPYEGIAFQFSHHIMYEDGRIEHAGEYLSTKTGEFPNFVFIRELKKQLENDNGTIFRYSPHENTYLNMIYRQLKHSNEVDKQELCDFIQTITTSTNSSTDTWHGNRSMVDLWILVKKYYYDPCTQGSNSIKAVLPAVLNSSAYLRNKYGQPIYGTPEIPSLNFDKHRWLNINQSGVVIDPYKSLPKMFSDISEHDEVLLSEEDELNSGGLALTAYAKMQFTEMSNYERTEIEKALLKYCELDTMAMVMIVEAWLDWSANDIE